MGMANSSRNTRSFYLFTDVVLLNLCFLIVSVLFRLGRFTADSHFLAQFIYINFFWLVTLGVVRVYQISRGTRFEQLLARLLRAYGLFSVLLLSFLYLFDEWVVSINHAEIKVAVWGVVFVLWRSFMAFIVNRMRRQGRNFRNVVIVGNGQPTRDLIRFFKDHPETGYKLVGIFSNESVWGDVEAYTGPIVEAQEFVNKNGVDELYCSLSGMQAQEVADLMNFADNSMIRFKVIPDFRGILNRKVNVDFYGMVPVLTMRNEPLQHLFNRVSKRAFDILFSLLVLLVVMPVVFVFVAPLVKLGSRGPVFFRQLRSGRDKEEFYCYKFRTMRVNPQADSLQSFKGDARVTPVGAFLRKTSLDELPQFWNVLVGHMSVVGPRPHMLKQTEEYTRLVNKYMLRRLVKPGITGWLQIHGFREDSRSHEMMEKRVEYDVWYVENWSMLLDLKIVLITAWQVISGRNTGY